LAQIDQLEKAITQRLGGINVGIDRADLTNEVKETLKSIPEVDVKVGGDTAALRGDLKKADAAAKPLVGTTRQISSNIKSAKNQAGGLRQTFKQLKGALAAAGLVVGFQQLVRGIRAAVDLASDFTEAQNKANEVFKESVGIINEFAENAPQAIGATRAEALEFTATLGNLFTSLGIARDESAEWSRDLVVLASDLASFNNLAGGTEEALVALRAGLTGQIRPLKAMGVAFNAAQVEAKALELGLADVNGGISEAAKVQARYALILELTKNAQGDFARTSLDLANAMRVVAAQTKEAVSQFGAALIPALTALIPIIVNLAEAFTPLGAALGELLGAAVNAVGQFFTALEPLQAVAIPLFIEIIEIVTELATVWTDYFIASITPTIKLLEAVYSGLSPVIAAIGALVDGLSHLGPILQVVATGFGLLKVASLLAAHPLLAVVGVVGLLIQGFSKTKDVTEEVAEAMAKFENGMKQVELGTQSATRVVRDLLTELVALSKEGGDIAFVDEVEALAKANRELADDIFVTARAQVEQGQAAAKGALTYAAYAKVLEELRLIERDFNLEQQNLNREMDVAAARANDFAESLGYVSGEAKEASDAILLELGAAMNDTVNIFEEGAEVIDVTFADMLKNLASQAANNLAFLQGMEQLGRMGLSGLQGQFEDAGVGALGALNEVLRRATSPNSELASSVEAMNDVLEFDLSDPDLDEEAFAQAIADLEQSIRDTGAASGVQEAWGEALLPDEDLVIEEAQAALDAFNDTLDQGFDTTNALLEGKADQINLTFDQMMDNLAERALQQQEFNANLRRLADISPELAAIFAEMGVGASKALSDALNDPENIQQRIDDLRAHGYELPPVFGGPFAEGMRQQAMHGATAFDHGFAVSLAGEGEIAANSFGGPFLAGMARIGGAGASQIKRSFRSGLALASPSKVFMEFGEDSAEGFAMGFLDSGVGRTIADGIVRERQTIQRALTGLRLDLPVSVAGGIAAAGARPAGGGGGTTTTAGVLVQPGGVYIAQQENETEVLLPTGDPEANAAILAPLIAAENGRRATR
jgi:hypothetical protein